MIVRPEKRENPYAQIDNRPLRDKRLSWRARGILAYLLTWPNDWKVMTANLVNQGTEGRDAVRAAFKELALFGYAVLVPSRFGKEWHIVEQPSPENPSLGHALKKPTSEKANVGKSATTKTVTVTDTESVTRTPKQVDGVLESQLERLKAVFHKRPTTPLDRSEKSAWSTLTNKGKLLLDEGEISLMERFYKKHWPPNRDKNHLRHALAQLLNNWGGEVDKARAWCEKHPLPSERKITAPRPAPVEEVPAIATDPNDPANIAFLSDFERQNGRLPYGWAREGEGFKFVGKGGTNGVSE